MEKIVGTEALRKLVSIIRDKINNIPKNIKDGSGKYSIVEGNRTTASGYASHAEGDRTTASEYTSHAEGILTTASNYNSHAEGDSTIASGYASHAEGYRTIASEYYSHAEGFYNKEVTNTLHYIGNGTYDASSNAFRVTNAGAVYALSAFNSSGADYAEYFEWEDGNVNGEDRIGHFVALIGDKVKIAEPGDDIIGVVSGISSVIGNTQEDTWNGMFVRDVYGRLIPKDYEETITLPNGETKTYTIKSFEINPNYNPNEEYIPRSKRKEWDVIGLLGQMIVIDDGTCISGGKCSVTTGGIATIGDDYRVLKRLDSNHVLIIANFI